MKQFDEINVLEYYEMADRVNKTLLKSFTRAFANCKRLLLKSDADAVVNHIKQLYENLYDTVVDYLFKLANKVYTDIREDEFDEIEDLFLFNILKDFNPVTKYSFDTEQERKRARCYEGVMSSQNIADELDIHLRAYAKMVMQYTDYYVWESVLKAYKDEGIARVEWCTEEDNRVCDDCDELDGVVFDISAVPPPQHWGCRCWLMPID